ncbi:MULTISPECIES: glucosamine-6-phosphate deaminase [unclassified Pseudonocardia]|uniref:glucosamine-6-phosphate deaminase n=1 Tax=unclassified Pseudonocardia TaxID=2619320 RepID=UPI000969E697|nr:MULTISPECIES: glucosamine-6-phosphate deaminase [unclassified Pseudonocardia]MBN9097347.1 glucosamine-6-phosphate deaminase [Pseudonocardia sp.]OJY48907.1 MAG: glucosamine-6-phosphate deaminase [Pseudonocardia sp. 73-21]
MEVLIHTTATEGAQVVADVVERAVRSGPAVLGLATGSSPLLAYRELIRRHREEGLSFAAVDAYLLDEYVGLPAGHPEFYREVIRRELTDHLDMRSVHAPDGTHPDPPAAAAAYERSLPSVGVQILGIGANGHVGFNEPGSSLTSGTRVKTLTRRTREDNARFFADDVDQVPRHVITQGLGTIGRAGHLLLTATGEHKAAAVAAAVEGPLTASCPASILQWHPHVTIVLDDAAASQLERADFYRETADRKPAWAR